MWKEVIVAKFKALFWRLLLGYGLHEQEILGTALFSPPKHLDQPHIQYFPDKVLGMRS
jgi:hypothetical protein